MMIYEIEGSKYMLSYAELKEKHAEFCQMSDIKFMANLAHAAHLACVIGYLKEIPAEHLIGDKGIVHELIHLMCIPDGNTRTLREIREQFKKQLKLS